MKLSNFILLLLLLLFNSCSEPLIDFDKQENICKYSKTLSLADSTGKNSLDLIVKTNSQILLDKYTTKTVSLNISHIKSRSSQLNIKSTQTDNDSSEKPSSDDYIEFIVTNEEFGENVSSYSINVDVEMNEGVKNEWIQQSWKVANDFCYIYNNASTKIYYKSSYVDDNDKISLCSVTTLLNSGSHVAIYKENSDSLCVFVTFKKYDDFSLSFSE